MMNRFASMNTIAFLGMVFFLMVACSDDNSEPNDFPNDDVQNIELPPSDVETPIISGNMIVVRGHGFTKSSEIWFQTSSIRSSGVKADIISYSDESISFIAPQMSGDCDVILKQDDKIQSLGTVYLENRDLESLGEHIYVIGYSNTSSEEGNLTPSLYSYANQSGNFQLKNELPQGEIVKFALPENNGSGNVYYFNIQRQSNTKKVNLCRYNILTQQEAIICTDWLNKFSGASNGMAIGMIENTLCGLEASIDKGFELISFGDDGKITLLKKAFPYAEINGKRVVQFYCEDDNLLFSYDSEKRCVLVTGKIRFEDDKETFDCLLSLNMKTGDVKLLRDEQDTYYYEVLVTRQGIVLLEIAKDTDKTIIKTINPETLETISVLDEVNESMTFSIYGEKSNSIYWDVSGYHVSEYNFDSKQISVSDSSLPHIETLFTIRY